MFYALVDGWWDADINVCATTRTLYLNHIYRPVLAKEEKASGDIHRRIIAIYRGAPFWWNETTDLYNHQNTAGHHVVNFN